MYIDPRYTFDLLCPSEQDRLRPVFSYNMGRIEVREKKNSKRKKTEMFSSVKFVCLNIFICRERGRKEFKTKEGAHS